MRLKTLLFASFIIVGVLFIVAFSLNLKPLLPWSNYLLVPLLLLYYRARANRLFLPVVVILLLFYVRDIFLFNGFRENWLIIMTFFLAGMSLLFFCLITGFRKARVHPLEMVSFLIMYCFLGFLFISLSEVVPEVLPGYKFSAYLYLFLLPLLVAGSFTAYILKSHLNSLWFMVATSAFLVSEISLFFQVFIIEDLSLSLFYPFFHVLAYYGLVEYAVRRRGKQKPLFV